MIVIISVIFCMFAFLFTLYLLAREDYILFRKNVTIEQVFNMAFILLLVSALSSRLFYVLFHFKVGYLNPLVFFHILKYPGLSLIGAMTGGLLFYVLYYRTKKLPFARLSDLFMLSFLSAVPFTFLPALFSQKTVFLFILNILFILFFISVLIGEFQLFLRWKGREGLLSLSVVSVFSFISLIDHLIFDKDRLLYIFSGDELLLFIVFILATVSVIFLYATRK